MSVALTIVCLGLTSATESCYGRLLSPLAPESALAIVDGKAAAGDYTLQTEGRQREDLAPRIYSSFRGRMHVLLNDEFDMGFD